MILRLSWFWILRLLNSLIFLLEKQIPQLQLAQVSKTTSFWLSLNKKFSLWELILILIPFKKFEVKDVSTKLFSLEQYFHFHLKSKSHSCHFRLNLYQVTRTNFNSLKAILSKYNTSFTLPKQTTCFLISHLILKQNRDVNSFCFH